MCGNVGGRYAPSNVARIVSVSVLANHRVQLLRTCLMANGIHDSRADLSDHLDNWQRIGITRSAFDQCTRAIRASRFPDAEHLQIARAPGATTAGTRQRTASNGKFAFRSRHIGEKRSAPNPLRKRYFFTNKDVTCSALGNLANLGSVPSSRFRISAGRSGYSRTADLPALTRASIAGSRVPARRNTQPEAWHPGVQSASIRESGSGVKFARIQRQVRRNPQTTFESVSRENRRPSQK